MTPSITSPLTAPFPRSTSPKPPLPSDSWTGRPVLYDSSHALATADTFSASDFDTEIFSLPDLQTNNCTLQWNGWQNSRQNSTVKSCNIFLIILCAFSKMTVVMTDWNCNHNTLSTLDYVKEMFHSTDVALSIALREGVLDDVTSGSSCRHWHQLCWTLVLRHQHSLWPKHLMHMREMTHLIIIVIWPSNKLSILLGHHEFDRVLLSG